MPIYNSGLMMLQRAAALDPLNYNSHLFLGVGFRGLRRYQEAIVALNDALTLALNASDARTELGITQYLLGDPQAAHSSCEKVADEYDDRARCMAMVYHKLGQYAEAESALTKLKARWGDGGPVVYAEVYTQWGDTAKGLDELETALRLRLPGLEYLKTDPLLDPLRDEPRFQAILKALRFPDS